MKNISSRYINGWTIYQGLLSLEDNCDVIEDWLFFTEENNLLKNLDNYSHNYKPKLSTEIIDNKLAFHDFLLLINEEPVPSYTIDESVKYPIYLKAKHSWKNDQKVPRGWICNNTKELEQKLIEIENSNWNRDWFFFQDFIDYPLQNNISVAGYFDYTNFNRNLSIVTRKVLGNCERFSCGTIVETIPDPNNLVQRTYKILDNLKYNGVFEMEFLFDEQEKIYYVLELNPRFWMQHGLFLKFFNNELIKRYLDIKNSKSIAQYEYRHLVWIDTISLLINTLKGNLDILKKYIQYRVRKIPVFLAPDLITALIFILKKISNKYLNTNIPEILF